MYKKFTLQKMLILTSNQDEINTLIHHLLKSKNKI